MLLSLLLVLATSTSSLRATPIRSSSERITAAPTVSCQLPSASSTDSNLTGSASKQFSVDIAYVRLTMTCIEDENDDINDFEYGRGHAGHGTGIAARLAPIRPSGQVWPPTPEASLDNVRFALAILRGLLPATANNSAIGCLRRLSMAGLSLPGGSVARLASQLTEFVGLSRLNLSAVGATSFPAELLSLPRLRSLHAGGNPLDCSLAENRWLRLLTRMGSKLLEPAAALLLQCSDGGSVNSSSAAAIVLDAGAANITEIDADYDSPSMHNVDLYGEVSVPCSRRYFRPSDVGIWTPDASVTWRRLEPVGSAELLLAATVGNDTSAERNISTLSSAANVWHSRQHRRQLTTRVEIGPTTLGAPLVIRGVRLAVVGLWRCELAKAGLVLAVRHRLVLRPPLEGLEMACYAVAGGTSVAMVLIGLAAALVRCLIRTHCCTRVVHIVEAQSVLHLDASPLQTRRRRQAAAADAATADEGDRWLEGIVAGPSGSGVAPVGAAGCLRDRLRDINDQMRLKVNNFSETVGSSVRAGWSSGVEHVKEQMRSMAEFCGVSNPPLGQTVSVVSVYTDPEGRQEPLEQHLHLLSSV